MLFFSVLPALYQFLENRHKNKGCSHTALIKHSITRTVVYLQMQHLHFRSPNCKHCFM